jgi:predicted DNA-binding transcriptional regulator AlpA
VLPNSPHSDLDLVADAIAAKLSQRFDRPALLNQVDALAYVGLPRSSWYRAKSAGSLPAPVFIEGVGSRWRKRDLDTWIERLKPRRRQKGGEG